jgi:XTP/dITP diphosphohydrolase
LSKSRIVFASKNRDKYREMVFLLKETPIELIYGPEVTKVDVQVQETDSSYSENALLKALAWSEALNVPALADDSGLEVTALCNEPGVHSARIAEDDESRILWLLNKLKGIENREALFVASIALVLPKMSQVWLTMGICYGKVSQAKRGNSGFGYDPIFVPKGCDKTFAELEVKVKNSISHRFIAVKALCDMFKGQNVLE